MTWWGGSATPGASAAAEGAGAATLSAVRRSGGRTWLAGALCLIVVASCTEDDVRLGFTPQSPVEATATVLNIEGPCNANPDVAVDEDELQIAVSVVWREAATSDGCVTVAEVPLTAPVGERDLVDSDAKRRWALVDSVWVSIGWCGVEARCESEADLTGDELAGDAG